jgi:hypothetical protein
MSSLSIAQGPASRKKLLELVCFILGMSLSVIIVLVLYRKDTICIRIFLAKENSLK